MRKLIIMLLLAGLAACSGNTDTPPAETKTEAPAAEPAKSAEPTPPPAEPAPTEPAKAPDPPKAADVKPADKPVTPPPANKGGRLLARFQTSMGNFTAELNEKEAPGTVENFAGLASGTKEWTDPRNGQKQKKPYYDGLTFHRVIGPQGQPPDGFMIQGGDPMGNGSGGPGFTIKDEFNNLKHDKAGVLAMARTDFPDSAGSQFYITLTATPFLDGRPVAPYVVFGQIIEGLDVVKKIGGVPTAGPPTNRPLTPVVINKVTIERK
jgi:peptidyl-prolyl cis-trans isomerase A (cyclophilin A)